MLAVAATLPEGLNLPLAGASAIVFLPLSYFMSQVASDFGKRLEPALWDSWGGPPTTRFLRHDNEEFNPVTRARVHAQLWALGLRVPTVEEEKADRPRALQLYASTVDELCRLTRDNGTFCARLQGQHQVRISAKPARPKEGCPHHRRSRADGFRLGALARLERREHHSSCAFCHGASHRLYCSRVVDRSSAGVGPCHG